MPGKNGCLLNTNDANTSQDWEGTTSARKCVEEGSCQCPRQEAVTQVVTQTPTGGSPGPGARERQVPTPCDSSRLDSVRGGQTSAVARGRKARLPPGWLLLDGGTGSYPGSRRRWGRRGTGVRGGEGRPSQTVGGGSQVTGTDDQAARFLVLWLHHGAKCGLGRTGSSVSGVGCWHVSRAGCAWAPRSILFPPDPPTLQDLAPHRGTAPGPIPPAASLGPLMALVLWGKPSEGRPGS